MGLDNIGPFDRSAQLPVAGRLEEADGTAWMAMYCLNLLEMAQLLACHDPTYEDVATKLSEHFAYISTALNDQGLWDEADGFYYDVLHRSDETCLPLKARSMVGLIPVFAVCALPDDVSARLPDFARRAAWFTAHKPELAGSVARLQEGVPGCKRLLSVPSPSNCGASWKECWTRPSSSPPHGLRSLSAYHRDHPFEVGLDGSTARLGYEPAESATGLFGGNSNWRGPVWFRSTTSPSRRCAATTSAWATASPSRCPPGRAPA